jgi:acetolactate synthase I/II/III large subunit
MVSGDHGQDSRDSRRASRLGSPHHDQHHSLDTVTFPDTDLAAIARGFGCAGVTVRTLGDLAAVRDWVAGPRDRPLVIDAKVVSSHASWWLEEAFRGH